jgi:hypothetical protein
VAGVGVALRNGGEPSTFAPTPDRRNEVEKIISAEIPSFQLGPSQIEALNWLADDDPANLDLDLVSTNELLERFIIALLYFSTGGKKNLDDSSGFLSAVSVCGWIGVVCEFDDGVLFDPMVVEIYLGPNNLDGRLPTKLGLLTGLRSLFLGKFATVSSSELDTITLLGSILQFISSPVL